MQSIDRSTEEKEEEKEGEAVMVKMEGVD